MKERNEDKKKERNNKVCLKMLNKECLAVEHEPRRDTHVTVAMLSFVGADLG